MCPTIQKLLLSVIPVEHRQPESHRGVQASRLDLVLVSLVFPCKILSGDGMAHGSTVRITNLASLPL
jgi:hypothetical protein